jgi:hypothetical protein
MEKRRANARIRPRLYPSTKTVPHGTPTLPTLPILSPSLLSESPTPSRAVATITHHSLALTYHTLHCLPHRNHLGHSSRTVPNPTTVLQRLKPLHNRRTLSGAAPVPGTPGSASWRVSPPDSSRSGAFLRSFSGSLTFRCFSMVGDFEG